jgi:hypothetical protein
MGKVKEFLDGMVTSSKDVKELDSGDEDGELDVLKFLRSEHDNGFTSFLFGAESSFSNFDFGNEKSINPL